MAGIHEIVRATPKPKRPPTLPGALLAELRSQVTRFEEFASVNREMTNLVEARLQELADTTISVELAASPCDA